MWRCNTTLSPHHPPWLCLFIKAAARSPLLRWSANIWRKQIQQFSPRRNMSCVHLFTPFYLRCHDIRYCNDTIFHHILHCIALHCIPFDVYGIILYHIILWWQYSILQQVLDPTHFHQRIIDFYGIIIKNESSSSCNKKGSLLPWLL